jgi:RNA polymerase sigma-70 factor (ECF subfamily)
MNPKATPAARPDLDATLFDFAEEYAREHERALDRLQLLVLDEDTCLARVAFLQALAEADGLQSSPRVRRAVGSFRDEIALLCEEGLFAAYAAGRLTPDRVARLDKLTRDPEAVRAAHRRLVGDEAEKNRVAGGGSWVAEEKLAAIHQPIFGGVRQGPRDPNAHLSHISTLWTLVSQAHHVGGAEVAAAQRQLLERYGSAIRRYLLGALRDTDAAEDLFQEFAYRFLHGDLRRADPQRGRFRDYVKGVLFHMVADYHKKRQRLPRQMAPDYSDPFVICEPDAEQEQAFLASWRDELLARTWTALAASDQAHRQSFHTVLRFKAEHREMRSREMVEPLGRLLGKTPTAAGVRKALERARDRFADLLLDEIAQALSNPTIEQLEQELIDLNLLEHCRPALERRRGR